VTTNFFSLVSFWRALTILPARVFLEDWTVDDLVNREEMMAVLLYKLVSSHQSRSHQRYIERGGASTV
jgi:hypothetical protein